jgi:hypothetical protein
MAMIANGHFRGPPAIPTLIAKDYAAARPREAELHAENHAGIERYADRPLSAERFRRVTTTSGRRIFGAKPTGSILRSRSSNGGPK